MICYIFLYSLAEAQGAGGGAEKGNCPDSDHGLLMQQYPILWAESCALMALTPSLSRDIINPGRTYAARGGCCEKALQRICRVFWG